MAAPVLSTDPARQSLRRYEKGLLIAFLLIVVSFGVLVEIRSAFISTRKTDLGCYLRAGWAVRADADIYEIVDDNKWHYAYPPVFAILMTPLADAPHGEPRDWMLPYPVTVALWYIFSAALVFLAVHWFALALEESGVLPSIKYSRGWWGIRMLPIFICLAPIGGTLQRGQVNGIVVAMIAGMFLAMVRGKRFGAGLWLASAICLKIFPAFLLLLPLWRRDRRTLTGVGAGLVIGLGFIPSMVWGVAGAVRVHERLFMEVMAPGLGLANESTRDKEMMEMTATDNQSIQATIHYYRNWDAKTRPNKADSATKLAHIAICGLLTGLLLLAYGWKRNDEPIRLLMFIGGLMTIMAIATPVSHTHYFCLTEPLVMGLVASSVICSRRQMEMSRQTAVLLVLAGVLFTLPHIPLWEQRREMGFPLFGCLLLWGATLVQLRARPPEAETEIEAEVKVEPPLAMAA